MIASLPMYDWPDVRDATDAFWHALRMRLGSSVALQRGSDHAAAWRAPDLLFSQTCGYPFTHEFRGRLKLVAVPQYDAPGCEGFRYSSFLFAREKRPLADFRGTRKVINTADSMSGMLALKFMLGSVAGAIVSGSHVQSMLMVQAGTADICAVDAVCVEMARRYQPSLLEGLVEVGRSPLVPGLPFVTVAGDVSALCEGLRDVLADRSMADVLARLLIKDVSFPDPDVYLEILELERRT